MTERDFTAEFHAHLDKCERCATNPIRLCTFGGWLLRRAALDAAVTLAVTMPTPSEAPINDA